MKDLFYYVFYRASKFYEDWGEKNGYIGGGMVAVGSLCFISLSIIVFVLHWFDEKINNNIIIGMVIIATLLSFLLNRKKYDRLAEKYKNEENSTVKGWFVFFYAIGSVILYIISMLLCDYWVNIEM